MRVGVKVSTHSNISMIPKLFNWVSSLCETQIGNGQVGSVNVGIRCLSSISGNNRENLRNGGDTEYNDFRNDDDDDDKFLRKGAGEIDNLNGPPQPIPGRPLRGGRQTPQFNTFENVSQGRDFGLRDRDSEARKQSAFSSADKFGYGNESKGDASFSGDSMNRKGSRPSVNDLFTRPRKDQMGNGQEHSDFLEKFKLSGTGNKESEESGNVTSAPPDEPKEEPPEEAEMIFKKMKETGLIPNAVAMLDGLCKDGLVQEAMKLFGLMREKGTMPEIVIYTAVVDGFFKAHKFEDAMRIFRKMQSNGITPNAYSYTVLIKGMCNCRRLEDAVDSCLEMLENGHSLNVATFSELINVFCKEKGVEEARKVVDALKQKGFFLDEKSVREHLNKNGPRSPMVYEAIFGPLKRGPISF